MEHILSTMLFRIIMIVAALVSEWRFRPKMTDYLSLLRAVFKALPFRSRQTPEGSSPNISHHDGGQEAPISSSNEASVERNFATAEERGGSAHYV